jgi:hypothetical protein
VIRHPLTRNVVPRNAVQTPVTVNIVETGILNGIEGISPDVARSSSRLCNTPQRTHVPSQWEPVTPDSFLAVAVVARAPHFLTKEPVVVLFTLDRSSLYVSKTSSAREWTANSEIFFKFAKGPVSSRVELPQSKGA